MSAYDDDEMMDIHAVAALLGGAKTPVSKATIWRGVKSGRLPAPIKIFRQLVRWRRSELMAALERAAAERTARSANLMPPPAEKPRRSHQ